MDVDDRIRFLDLVDSSKEGGCWPWLGRVNRGGYGQFGVEGEVRPAHRVMYEEFVGPIPEGLTLDHLCRNRACCNYNHLDPCTLKENILRSPDTLAGANVRKTHCPQGHPYLGENLYVSPAGFRRCRKCVRAAGRRWYAKTQKAEKC